MLSVGISNIWHDYPSGGSSPVTVPVLVALLVCLIPTTIGGLLSAIGIAGMDRVMQEMAKRQVYSGCGSPVSVKAACVSDSVECEAQSQLQRP